MYLLDTNVVSELRRARPHGAVLAWFNDAGNPKLYLSAVTIGEIQAGIEMTRERDRGKAAEIEEWLGQIVDSFEVLAADARVFRRWAGLMHRRPDALIQDALIAATALVHGLTVATRNVQDFGPLGVAIIDPFRSPAS